MDIFFFDEKKMNRQEQLKNMVKKNFGHNNEILSIYEKIEFNEKIPEKSQLKKNIERLKNALVFIHPGNMNRINADILKELLITNGGRFIWYSGENTFPVKYVSEQEIWLNYEHNILPFFSDFLKEFYEEKLISMKKIFDVLHLGIKNREMFNLATNLEDSMEILVRIYWLICISLDNKNDYLKKLKSSGLLTSLENDIEKIRTNEYAYEKLESFYVKIESKPWPFIDFCDELCFLVSDLISEQSEFSYNLEEIKKFFEILFDNIQNSIINIGQ